MPKNKLTDYSATNASNTDVGGINIDEGMLPSSVNDAIREVMTHLKDFSEGTQPINALDVAGTITSDGLTVDGDATISSGTPTLQLTDTGGTNQFATFKQDGSNLKILSRNNTVSGGILMRRNVGGTETDAIQLSANGDVSLYASDGATQGFFWDASTQRLGLGTTSPARTLDIQADSGTNIPLIVRGGSSQTNAFIAIRDTNTTADFNNRIGSVGDNLVLYTNQTERLRITSAGNVGIGTASPSRPLDVVADANDNPLRLRARGGGTSAYITFSSNDATTTNALIGNPAANTLAFYTNGFSERLRISSDGNLQAGATSGRGGGSTGHLFKMPSGDVYFEIMGNAAGSNTDILFSDGTGGSYGVVGYDHTNDALRFFANSGEKMRIDSSGNLLVSKTSANSTTDGIELRGGSGAVRFIGKTDSNAVGYLNRGVSDGDILQFAKDNTTVGIISAYAGNIIAGSGDTGIFFYDDDDVLRPVSPTTRGTRDNAIDIGSSGARWKDLYLSGTASVGTAVAATQTASVTGSTTLDFSTYQNFILTMTGNITLANPTTEQAGQTGFMILIHSGAARTVSLGTDYETAGGAGLTLSSTSGAVDLVPYVVQSSGNILLGAPQLAFA
jgi:hypothetical protein